MKKICLPLFISQCSLSQIQKLNYLHHEKINPSEITRRNVTAKNEIVAQPQNKTKCATFLFRFN